MVSSIAIGLGFSAWRGSGEPAVMSNLDAFALRGVVVAAIASTQEPVAGPDTRRRRVDPASHDHVYPWHFIR
jgi:hypothetical protein